MDRTMKGKIAKYVSQVGISDHIIRITCNRGFEIRPNVNVKIHCSIFDIGSSWGLCTDKFAPGINGNELMEVNLLYCMLGTPI